jgi:hypothetical protein
MRTYIVNLTNNLIGNHGFDLVFQSMKSEAKNAEWKEGFVNLVLVTISSREIREMSPETLGRVVCDFEGFELPCYQPSGYFGNPDQYLRNVVSSMLAWSIRYRLDDAVRKSHDKIPPYPERRKTEADYSPLSGNFGP